MNPKYLNAKQKEALTKIVACGQFLEDAIAAAQMPPDIAANLKRGRTYTWKAGTEWLKRQDAKTQRTILNIIKDTTILMTQKKVTLEQEREALRYIGGREYLDVLAENAMTSKCGTCDGKCRSECSIYESFVHFDVTVLDEHHPECPYSGVEV